MPAAGAEGESADKDQSTDGETEGAKEETLTEEPKQEEAASSAPVAQAKGKGRVVFIYTCPSGSPIKFRMVYSSGVRGIQQDAKDKSGIDISAKVGLDRMSQSYTADILARDIRPV
jgi:hypothetical protein